MNFRSVLGDFKTNHPGLAALILLLVVVPAVGCMIFGAVTLAYRVAGPSEEELTERRIEKRNERYEEIISEAESDLDLYEKLENYFIRNRKDSGDLIVPSDIKSKVIEDGDRYIIVIGEEEYSELYNSSDGLLLDKNKSAADLAAKIQRILNY